MAQYNDLFMRDNMNDSGQVPDPERVFWTSPDIIPWGTVQATSSQLQGFQQWSQQWNVSLSSGQINYIYVRACNLWNGAETGQVTLYWAPSSLLLNSPQWIGNQLLTASAGGACNLSAAAKNQVAVGSAPFQWNPPQPQNNYHYCLIAIVGTPNHAAPMPPQGGFSSSADFAAWVLGNPAVAQRNVTIVNYPPPPSWQQTQNFANLDSSAEQYLFNVDIGSLPAGSSVSFSCSAPGPQPQINASGTVPQGNSGSYYVSQVTTLPALFAASLVVTLNVAQGGSVPSGGITIEYGRIVNSSNDHPTLVALSRSVAEVGAAEHVDASFRVVILGSCYIDFASTGGGQ